MPPQSFSKKKLAQKRGEKIGQKNWGGKIFDVDSENMFGETNPLPKQYVAQPSPSQQPPPKRHFEWFSDLQKNRSTVFIGFRY